MVMKADDLRLDELVHFATGMVDIKGRRLVLHDLHAMGQFRRDIIEMVGSEQARRIFTRFGYFWGQADAASMKRMTVKRPWSSSGVPDASRICRATPFRRWFCST